MVFTFRVDGAEISAETADGRIVLSCPLTDDESLLPSLARYAGGRMLREDATLSFGQPGLSSSGSGSSAFLWQDAPADADERTLLRLFESFADSCDWWRARVDEREADGAAEISEAVIRP